MADRALTVVEEPALADVGARLNNLNTAHRIHANQLRIGAMVLEFTNAELRVLAEAGFLTYGDVLTFRRLGLLAEDEGYDGSDRDKKRWKAHQKGAGGR